MPHVILFYKYAPLSSDPAIMVIYQKAMHDLCVSLNLTGRVLVGMSDDAEGINGTLAGGDENDVLAYTYAMLGKDWCHENAMDMQMDAIVFANPTPGPGPGPGPGPVRGPGHGPVPGDVESCCYPTNENINTRSAAIHKFWTQAENFFQAANVPVLTLDSPLDFKWSSVDIDVDVDVASKSNPHSEKDNGLFPDLQIKLVKEIIGTGGVLSSVSIQDTSKGYLTPKEWHEEMKRIKDHQDAGGGDSTSKDNTVLIDCRNHKEFEIGHFDNALDPNTKTFEQFPRWVLENKSALKDKNILMYCTGGIRCEKASAYMRRELEAVSDRTTVQHLKGGIHKYLDEFGADGYFLGKNFVFDRRVGVDAEDHVKGRKDGEGSSSNKHNNSTVTGTVTVGKCLYCEENYDNFTADAVCTVCREMTLVCADCKTNLYGEYHCSDHQHLKTCYFTNLSRFTREELTLQLRELEALLEAIAVGKRYKQKRRTLQKQIGRVSEALLEYDMENCDKGLKSSEGTVLCRSCGDAKCNGECWGVHGLKRKLVLEQESAERPKKSTRTNANQRSQKVIQREKDIMEIKRLCLSQPCSVHRCSETSIRCPPPFVRELSSSVKGKWVGRSVQSVLQSEFHELSDTERLEALFKKSLVKVNGIPVNSEAALMRGVEATKALSQDVPLKNMDVISRVTHWHEPPVEVPEKICVKKVSLPQAVLDEYLASTSDEVSTDDVSFYCCDKPSTVPAHPTGPYLQNTLTLMVEAQEGLEPRSLLPCHRLDRCTSGLTLCCVNPAVARLLQVQMDNKMVEKSYVARVKVSTCIYRTMHNEVVFSPEGVSVYEQC